MTSDTPDKAQLRAIKDKLQGLRQQLNTLKTEAEKSDAKLAVIVIKIDK